MFTPNVTGLKMSDFINSKAIVMLLCLSLLTACSMSQERTGETNLKSGDTIMLNEDLTTPRGKFHIKFQHGEIKQKIKAFSNNCIIESRFKGPVTYNAGPYTVMRVKYGEEFFSDGGATVEYSTTFSLEALTASGDEKNSKLELRCKVLDNTMMHHVFPVPDIKQVMGDFMDFPQGAPTPSPEPSTHQSSSSPATASP